MALPINIGELLKGNTVEWDRIEFKKGWNPEEVIRTMCAFANDINNWGGGYIFIGVEEKDGLPVLPPVGINPGSLDAIQKELLSLCHQVHPHYMPVSQPYELEGRYILVIWAPGGDNRPYKAPSTLGTKGQHRYYVRRGPVTVPANEKEAQLLLELAKRIPFDDRVAHKAQIDDLDFGLIRAFLQEVKSDLRHEAARIPLPQLAEQMRISGGPPEAPLPLNVGLLFFTPQPDKWFRGAQTDVVFYEDVSGKRFTEKHFAGPLHLQLRAVLSYIQTNFIEQKVIKVPRKAEALRLYNYPFEALEEVVANAFYHRSYELQNPVEINIWPDRIEVLSFPGPLPPVTREKLKERRIVARDYRNRRVGDFFKELRLTEGRATGFPTIYDSMEGNGSPAPSFETDDDYGYFLAHLPIHRDFLLPAATPHGNVAPADIEQYILALCLQPQSRAEVLAKLELKNHLGNYRKYLLPLVEYGWLALTHPDVRNSPFQRYYTTEAGKEYLQEMRDKTNRDLN